MTEKFACKQKVEWIGRKSARFIVLRWRFQPDDGNSNGQLAYFDRSKAAVTRLHSVLWKKSCPNRGDPSYIRPSVTDHVFILILDEIFFLEKGHLTVYLHLIVDIDCQSSKNKQIMLI